MTALYKFSTYLLTITTETRGPMRKAQGVLDTK